MNAGSCAPPEALGNPFRERRLLTADAVGGSSVEVKLECIVNEFQIRGYNGVLDATLMSFEGYLMLDSSPHILNKAVKLEQTDFAFQ